MRTIFFTSRPTTQRLLLVRVPGNQHEPPADAFLMRFSSGDCMRVILSKDGVKV